MGQALIQHKYFAIGDQKERLKNPDLNFGKPHAAIFKAGLFIFIYLVPI